jgi:predicted transposase/invertase (TIGR01784 family)
MQMYWNNAFLNRMLFNVAKAYVSPLNQNEDYIRLQPVYGLAILNDTFYKTEEFYHHFRLVNDKETGEVIEGMELVLLELPKFRPETWIDRRMAVLWLRFLKEVDESKLTIPDDLKENEDIRRALDICEKGAFTDVEIAAYDKYWDIIRTENTLIRGGEARGEARGLEKGKAIGREEGKAIGLEKGEAIGLEKGEAIGLEKALTRTVLNCKRNGFSMEQIQEITGLGEERILEILRPSGGQDLT